MMLDARTHGLLLASPKVGTAEFIVVGVASRFFVHTLYFILGRWYGEAALRWVASRSRLASRVSARTERAFNRFAVPAVLILSNKPVCILAGSAGMGAAWFVVLHLAGTILRIIAIRMLAQSNHEVLGGIDDVIDRNAGWLTVVFVIGTIATVTLTAHLHRRRPRKPSAAAAAAAVHPEVASDNGSPEGRREDT